jgi:hypothetical protein
MKCPLGQVSSVGAFLLFHSFFPCDSIILSFMKFSFPFYVCDFVMIIGRVMKIMHSCKVIIQGYDILRTIRVVCHK